MREGVREGGANNTDMSQKGIKTSDLEAQTAMQY